MSNPTMPSPDGPMAGWRIFRSDAGRLWATRDQPFVQAAEYAGAYRTVDGDDLPELCMRIAAQEATAQLVALL